MTRGGCLHFTGVLQQGFSACTKKRDFIERSGFKEIQISELKERDFCM